MICALSETKGMDIIMKKILSFVIGICIVVNMFATLLTFAETDLSDDGYEVMGFADDFENFSNPLGLDTIVPTNWVRGGGDTVLPIDFEDERYNIAAGIKGSSEQTGKRLYLNQAALGADETFNKVKLEFDIYIPNGLAANIQIYRPDGTRATVLLLSDNNSISKTIGSARTTIGSYNSDTWNRLTLYVNCEKKLITAYLGDILLEKDIENPELPDYVASFGIATAARGEDFICIDNVKILTPVQLNITNTAPITGCEDFPVKDGAVLFICDRDIRPNVDDLTVTVKDANQNEIIGFSETITGNKMIIKFTETLDFNEIYTITYNNVSIDVETMSEGLAAGMPLFLDESETELITMPSEGEINTSVVVENHSNDAKEAVFVLGIYDEQNNMVAMNYSSVEIAASGSEQLRAAVNLESYDSCRAMAFVLDSFEDLNLLRSDFAVLDYNEADNIYSFSGKGNAELTLSSIFVHENYFTVNAGMNIKGERTLLIYTTNPNGEISFIAPVLCDDNGNLHYSYSLHGDAEVNGIYKMNISGRKVNEVTPFHISYLNKETQNSILQAVNSARTGNDVESALRDYIEHLNIDHEYFNQNGYQTLFEQKPFAEYIDISKILTEAKDLLERINSTNWSDLSAVIMENSEIIMFGNSDYSYYSNLFESDQNIINKNIKSRGVFNSFSSFRMEFSNAVNDYKESLNREKGFSRSSGSSGRSVTLPIPKTSLILSETDIDSGIPSFNDLQQVEWAKNSILYLYEHGIVSGDGDGNFRPLDNITREEFVRLVVEAFNIEKNDDEGIFTDANPEAWYTPYLSASKQLGIIEGRDDGSFGVGSFITRQDMAVIVYRAVIMLDILLPRIDRESTGFIDADEISEYAMEAVSNLKNAGVISGMGDGNFAPFNNANRAEASKIIFNLIYEEEAR
jgi:hypothetical protein